MAAEERCAYGDTEFFGGCLTVDRSTRQGDVISISDSVLD